MPSLYEIVLAMPSLEELALLGAFISPVLVLVAINVVLILKGEVDTLLIPGLMHFDPIVIAEEPVAAKPAAEEAADEPEVEPLRAAA